MCGRPHRKTYHKSNLYIPMFGSESPNSCPSWYHHPLLGMPFSSVPRHRLGLYSPPNIGHTCSRP